VHRPLSAPLAKFFADRGPHLAAMIAYFGLLSSVSLIFLALALLGWTGRAEESSYLVRELERLFPQRPIDEIVRVVEAITENATTLGVIGAAFLLWTSLSLFSVLESAFNLVYGLPNRPFLRGKGLATLFMMGSLVVLFAALVLGAAGFDVLQRAAVGAVLLQLTFQVLPLFVLVSRDVVAVQALGTSVLLLVWLYVMANVIVFGAEINWWREHGAPADEITGLA